MTQQSSGPSMVPEGVVREATAPQRVVVLWSQQPVELLVDALVATGHLPMRLAPEETLDLLEVSGPPAMVMVEADVLSDAVTEVLERIRAESGRTRVVVLAHERSGAAGLLAAMRLGLSDVIDPDDPGGVTEALGVLDEGSAGGERVLAVGAHPDDVEIGCGGTLLRHRDNADAITVLTLSRGDVGGLRERRRTEAVAAAMQLSADLLMADLPDTRIQDAGHDAVRIIEEVIALTGATIVYVHSRADNHQDHRAVHEATVIAARRVPSLLCYQSPSSQNGFAPTKYIPIAATVAEKVELLAHYRSQSTRHYLEPDLITASARYWARQLDHTRFAEPFEVLRDSNRS